MKDLMTPQLIAGGVLLLLTLVLTLGILTTGPGSYPVRNRDLEMDPAVGGELWQAAEITGPVVAEAAGQRQLNPFSLRQETTGHQVKIGAPPPPPLLLPELPVAPVREERP